MTAPAAQDPVESANNEPSAELSALSPSRWWSRAAILAAGVGAFVTLRIDRFITIATETDWLPDFQRDERIAKANPEWCTENVCFRLPLEWIVIAVVVGFVSTALVLVALFKARKVFPVTKDTPELAPTIGLLERLWWGVLGLGVLVAVARVLVALNVQLAAIPLLIVAIAQVAAVLISVLILARLAAPKLDNGDVDWSGAAATIGRQRATIILVVLFALFLLALPITTPQSADALRALTFGNLAGWANSLFLIATAALMSATVLQVWRAADRIDAETPETPKEVKPLRWLLLGVGVIVVGVILAVIGLTGCWGLTVLGVIFIVFAGLERGRDDSVVPAGSVRDKSAPEQTSDAAEAKKEAKATSTAKRAAIVPATGDSLGRGRGRVSLAARYVAAIPLASLAIALIAAVVEMVIAEQPLPAQWSGPVVTALFLGGLAVRLTRTITPPPAPPPAPKSTASSSEDSPQSKPTLATRRVVLWIVLALVVATLVFLFFGPSNSWWAFGAGLAAAGVFVFQLLYVSDKDQVPGALLILPKRLPKAGIFKLATDYGLTIPFALASGFFAMLLVHVSPFDAARTLGTVALLNVFMATLLAAGFYVSFVGRRFQAPWSLDWFGSKRLPVYTMLLVWWVIAGLLAPPALHDVRLIDREADVTTAPPTLSVAFQSWIEAQPELVDVKPGKVPALDPKTRDVVPLVLIASHGGGIRAAYWTGVVLDCIVGANATSRQDSVSGENRDEDQVRAGACADERRDSEAALAAARRVFLASSVSGGAIGMAAYSQQILKGDLHEGWIDERLSDDLLAPVIGWSLFHDLPNHLLGLTAKAGGACTFPTAYGCLTQDRAAILEEAIDRETTAEGVQDDDEQTQSRDAMTLRGTWEERTSGTAEQIAVATAVPLLVFNSSTTGSPNRAVTSAANLSDWPKIPDIVTDEDYAAARPVSDAAESIDVLCVDQDLRISTAAMLAARFPYVSPTGRIPGDCDPADTTTEGADCTTTLECQLQLADGGDLENSGLMTLAEIMPTLQTLVTNRNADYGTGPAVAIVVVDIDNEYRDEKASPVVPSPTGETLAPPTILLKGAAAMESAAYGLMYKRVPTSCFITMAPVLRPGIQAPLGWALSDATRDNLKASLVQPGPSSKGGDDPLEKVQLLQSWLTTDAQLRAGELRVCVPD